MALKDDLAYIFQGNHQVKAGSIISEGLKDQVAAGTIAFPRKGPVPREMAETDGDLGTPILMRLQRAGAYEMTLGIPARFRKALGWAKGDLIKVERVGNTLLLTKAEDK